MDKSVIASAPVAAIVQNVERVIVGKRDAIRLALVALLAEGHLLIEDVPGVGKTLLAKALARSISCRFKRIQFTPDLLPSDVSGVSIFNQKTTDFEFKPGPVFSHILLADEINRASPKTQSALLECMEERQVTVDGATYALEVPFAVIATQNPVEYEGTYQLPEAQLDRFMFRLSLGYPSFAEEVSLLEAPGEEDNFAKLQAVVDRKEFIQLLNEVRSVYASEAVRSYVVSLITQTRTHPDIYLGASPRASVAWVRAAQALAYISGRDFVIPDDVKVLALPLLSHRLVLRPESRLSQGSVVSVVEQIGREVPVPS